MAWSAEGNRKFQREGRITFSHQNNSVLQYMKRACHFHFCQSVAYAIGTNNSEMFKGSKQNEFVSPSLLHMRHRWAGASAHRSSSGIQAERGSLGIHRSSVTETREGKCGQSCPDSLKLLPTQKCPVAFLYTFHRSKQITWSQV